MSTYYRPHLRPRRLRSTSSLRDLVAEHQLLSTDLVWPVFIIEGTNKKEPITSLPGVYRYSLDLLCKEINTLVPLGLKGLALFTAIDDSLKDSLGTEGYNSKGLMPRAIQTLKIEFPELILFTDVAMDPYSSDGHDGIVKNGKILNDPTLEVLGKMALTQAAAGADFVAPSDMMDHRVGYLRQTLDENNFESVGIMSYAAKYASHFYGPFREALDSQPKEGDKKTYQMNPANAREALKEIKLDLSEGADIVMVKPALSYLDIIYRAKRAVTSPVAAYNVSGEYNMIKALSKSTGGQKTEEALVFETLLSMKRAGADLIFSYHSPDVLGWMNS